MSEVEEQLRERIMAALASRAAARGERHPELLDASHIIEDRAEGGLPIVSNGAQPVQDPPRCVRP